MNTLARIVRAREALENGDTGFAYAIVCDLEEDLACSGGSALPFPQAPLERSRFTCPQCSATFRWPGLLAHHQDVTGHGLDVDLRTAA